VDNSPPITVLLIALAGLLIVLGPPLWWYSRGKKLGERREKNWIAIGIGILLLASLVASQPAAKGNWLAWSASMVRVLGGVWLIAYGAKGSKA
jgi:hypothetical protein